jgi:predicted DNA-binding antitoxin AbrB/MazE fold protein
MNTIRAIYENGVFRPLDPVDLPEGSEVLLSVKVLEPPSPAVLDALYEILSRRHRSGNHDTAERHNEHS